MVVVAKQKRQEFQTLIMLYHLIKLLLVLLDHLLRSFEILIRGFLIISSNQIPKLFHGIFVFFLFLFNFVAHCFDLIIDFVWYFRDFSVCSIVVCLGKFHIVYNVIKKEF